MIGLTEKSDTKELIINQDEDTSIRYSIVEEKIDLLALKREKEQLEQEINLPEPSNEELIETGKIYHPYYMRNLDSMRERVKVIDSLIGK